MLKEANIMNPYTDLPDISEAISRTAADDALFAEIAAVLDKHNAIDRFGIALLHTHFPIAEGEILVEETDPARRVQRIAPERQAPARAIETAWRLGPDGGAVVSCYCRISMDGSHMGHVRGDDDEAAPR